MTDIIKSDVTGSATPQMSKIEPVIIPQQTPAKKKGIDFDNLTAEDFGTIKSLIFTTVMERALAGKTDFIDVIQEAIRKVSK